MRKKMLQAHAWLTVFVNDLDAFVPEVWAQESLMILEANMVMANLVHRDFSPEIAAFGDVVNTRRPARFYGKRKTDNDNVTVQDAVANNVAVRLDQHLHTSFIIKDGEESKGFQNLVQVYLTPALWSIAQSMDEIIMGQVYEFLPNSVGQLGVDPTRSTLIDTREIMNVNKAYQAGRNLVLSPDSEGALLDVDGLIEANKIGDDGTALREASLGRKMGFDIFMSQNTPSISSGAVAQQGAINNGAGYSAGDTVLLVDSFGADVTVGAWVTIAGDLTPQQVVAADAGPTTTITISPGLKSNVADNAVITEFSTGAVNFAGNYAQGYCKEIVIDGGVTPAVGQLTSFGALANYYSQIKTPTAPSATGMELNRCLDVGVNDNDVVGLGPNGNYNFAFHRDALTLVSRPLATPMPGTGAMSSVANFNGLSVRVTITYDGNQQGHLVTVDLLCGVKTLDTNLGAVMLG